MKKVILIAIFYITLACSSYPPTREAAFTISLPPTKPHLNFFQTNDCVCLKRGEAILLYRYLKKQDLYIEMLLSILKKYNVVPIKKEAIKNEK